MSNRLISRKLWVTITGIILLALNNQWQELTTLIIGYVVAQGGVDIVNKIKKGVSTADDLINSGSHNIIEDDLSDQPIVAGNATPLFDEEVKED